MFIINQYCHQLLNYSFNYYIFLSIVLRLDSIIVNVHIDALHIILFCSSIGFDVLPLIGIYLLELLLFSIILYIATIDIHFQSTFISFITNFILLLKIFMHCIVIAIGFNHCHCASYYLSLIHSIMIF